MMFQIDFYTKSTHRQTKTGSFAKASTLCNCSFLKLIFIFAFSPFFLFRQLVAGTGCYTVRHHSAHLHLELPPLRGTLSSPLSLLPGESPSAQLHAASSERQWWQAQRQRWHALQQGQHAQSQSQLSLLPSLQHGHQFELKV